MIDNDELYALLQKTSRTFALSIPLLPEPTRSEVTLAYLLFRIADTLEDAERWPSRERVQALEELSALLLDFDRERAEQMAARWLARPPLDHEGYLELLRELPRLGERLLAQRPAAREIIVQHARRSAAGMINFVERSDAAGALRLETLGDLRDYCYAVAGIVGEMLTELFVLGRPELAGVTPALRARAIRFGEGLQLVNILKDVAADAAAGKSYLPRSASLASVLELAERDLVVALEYCDLLRSGGAPRGLWAFNTLNTRLAVATLRGPLAGGSKLTRIEVNRMRSEVLDAVQGGDPACGAA
jgi:farnesyl-diphosphate farnesyltransferase